MKELYKANIEKQTLHNKYYRKVLYTTPQMQLVLMNVPQGTDIGFESHKNATQFIRVEKGAGVAYIADSKFILKDGDAFIIPSNTRHNVIATTQDLQLYTLYAPPQHTKGTVEKVKMD